MLPGYQELDREIRYRGDFISVVRAKYLTPDSAEVAREFISHPGAVTVVPVTTAKDALAIWQFRVPVGREIFEVCAGKRDVEGEAPETTASRELGEEMGIEAAKVVRLGSFFNSPGFCDEETIIFLALGLSRVERRPQGVEEENMRLASVRLDLVPKLFLEGVIRDAKTVLSLELARNFLNGPEGRELFDLYGSSGDPDAGAGFSSVGPGQPSATL